jgi:hypothetical protein
MSEYDDEIQRCTSLDRLFELWRSKAPVEFEHSYRNETITVSIDHSKNFFIPDGIVDTDIWNSGKKKRILFLLKEAYGTDWGNYTLATWLHSSHPNRKIWKKIAILTYGIQNTTAASIPRYREKLTADEHEAALDQIAVINIKKSDGKTQSDYAEIDAYAQYDRKEIIKELQLISPEIIICGSTFGSLFTTVLGNEPLNNSTRNDNWYYDLDICGTSALVIDYYHPANRYPELMNYYGLLGIYQQALIERDSRR